MWHHFPRQQPQFGGMRFGGIFLLALLMGHKAWAQNSFDEAQTTLSNVRMTVNNLGSVGNSFKGSYTVEGYGSCEFPAGSNVEHIFEGGLWVGAELSGGTILVSTGAIDDPSGYSTGKAGFEYSADVGSTLLERSTLLDNPRYAVDAVSHQDFVSDFTDRNIIVPGTGITITDHTPLGVDVHFEAYNWNYSFANFFVILNYRITNTSTNTWTAPWLGYWLDAVVRNVSVTPAGSGGTSFYNKGGTGYIDSLKLCYEFDVNGDPGFTDSYIGLKFLGAEKGPLFYHPEIDTAFKLNFNSWQFRDFTSSYRTPSNDAERYARLQSSLTTTPEWASGLTQAQLRQARNSSYMLSAGPFPDLAPGESLNIAFAVIPAKKFDDGNPTPNDTPEQKANLVRQAGWAQAAYNGEDQNFNGVLDPGEDKDLNGKITRFILPSPPDVPKTRIVSEENRIVVYWANNAEASVDPISQRKDFEGYRLYKTQVGFEVQNVQDILGSLKLVAQFDSAGNALGFDNGFAAVRLPQPKTFPNDPVSYTYAYTFENVLDGWQHGVSLTAYDTGDELTELEPLESSQSATLKRTFPGKPANANFQFGDPFVYPNPYYSSAAWEGSSSSEEDRRVMFANLPPRCEVRIYNLAGDFIQSFKHDEAYNGSDTRWFRTYSDTTTTAFSGGEHAWDLVSKDRQIIARGIYLFAVKDLDSGEFRRGKFVVIK